MEHQNDLSAYECMRRIEVFLRELREAADVAASSADNCVSITLSRSDNIATVLNRCVKIARDIAFETIKGELTKKGFTRPRVDRKGEANWELETTADGISVSVTYRILANNLVGLNYSISTEHPRRRVHRKLTSIDEMLARIQEMSDVVEDRGRSEN